jgi:hypothetical protein
MLKQHLDRLRALRATYLADLEAKDPEDLPLLAAKGDHLAGMLLRHGRPLPEPYREEYLTGETLRKLQRRQDT